VSHSFERTRCAAEICGEEIAQAMVKETLARLSRISPTLLPGRSCELPEELYSLYPCD